MSTTITIRTETALRSLLEERAAAAGKSLSEVVREILEAALAAQAVDERAGHLAGRLRLPRRPAGRWRRQLRERNWRP